MTARARTFVAVAANAPINDDGSQWIEVMPTATKARNGRFYFTLTRADLDTYADYIRSNADRIVIDYDHEGADGGSTAAAGWFTGEAEVRDTDDGPRLFALVEWTPQGLEDVKTKRFRFISPEFSFREKDSKTGLMSKAKELIAATLTNRPFFVELAALAANEGLLEEADIDLLARVMDDAFREVCTAALKSDDEQTRKQMLAYLNTLDGETVDDHEGDAMPIDPKALAKAAGLDENATEEQILEAVTAAASKPVLAEDAVVVDKATVEQLTASAAKGEQAHAELQTLKVKTLLDDAVRDFKIIPAQRQAYEAMAAADFDGVKALIESTPKDAIRVTTRGAGGEAGEGEPEEREIEAVKAQFSSELGDDAPDEQALLHVKAMEILGKPDYTTAEYVAAHTQAERDLGTVYRERPTSRD